MDDQIIYSYITKQDVENQFNIVNNFANINITGFDTFIGLVASFISKTAPAGIAYTVIKAAAEIESAVLKNFLNEVDQYGDWCIFVKSTYKFTGWGTGLYDNGYATYELSSVDYYLETGE